MVLTINQGDSVPFVETVTGINSLVNYAARMYIRTLSGDEVDTIEGTINGLVVLYEVFNEDTKVYPIGRHLFETKLFDAHDHVHTPSIGVLIVNKPIINDPV